MGMIDSTGSKVEWVVHENEYVMPKWMVENPKYANVLGYLESERMRKNGFADSEYTTPVAIPIPQ